MSIEKQLKNLTDEEILEIADTHYSAREYLRTISISGKGQYGKILNDRLKSLNLEWKSKPKNLHTKICPVCNKEFQTPIGTTEERTTCGYACSNTYFRSGKNNGRFKAGSTAYRNIAFNEYGKKCNRCGISDEDVLVVHHKDRDRENNKVDNLEVLCANCHMKEHKSPSSP